MTVANRDGQPKKRHQAEAHRARHYHIGEKGCWDQHAAMEAPVDSPYIRSREEIGHQMRLDALVAGLIALIQAGRTDELPNQSSCTLLTAGRPFSAAAWLIRGGFGKSDCTYEARRRSDLRHADGDSPVRQGMIIGWHNVEAYKVPIRRRREFYFAVPAAWKAEWESSILLAVPNSLIFSYMRDRFCAVHITCSARSGTLHRQTTASTCSSRSWTDPDAVCGL